jgi:DivIVA domain-containing protein
MVQLLLLTIGALVVGAIGFGIAVLVSGSDPGLRPVEPEGRAVPLPTSRPLLEADFAAARFDTVLRGYRMAQVDNALRRAAYDIGYKQELIGVLEAEVEALREGRLEDADKLRAAREAALKAVAGGGGQGPADAATGPDGPVAGSAAPAGPTVSAGLTASAASAAPGAEADAARDAGAHSEAERDVAGSGSGADSVTPTDGATDSPAHRPHEMKLL